MISDKATDPAKVDIEFLTDIRSSNKSDIVSSGSVDPSWLFGFSTGVSSTSKVSRFKLSRRMHFLILFPLTLSYGLDRRVDRAEKMVMHWRILRDAMAMRKRLIFNAWF